MTATTTTAPGAGRLDDDIVDLVTRAQGGDSAAFAALYERYLDQVFGYVQRRVQHRQLAEDLTADVFVNAFRRIGSFRWRGVDVGAWFIAIARNRVHDHFKSARSRLERPTDEIADGPGDDGDDPAGAVEDADLTAALTEMLAQLPEQQREVIELRFVHELSLADTAVALGRTVAATKALQHRALKGLARAAGSHPRLAGIVAPGLTGVLGLLRTVLP